MAAKNVRFRMYDVLPVFLGRMSRLSVQPSKVQDNLRVLGVTLSEVPEESDTLDRIKQGILTEDFATVFDPLDQSARQAAVDKVIDWLEAHGYKVDREEWQAAMQKASDGESK